MLDNNISGSVVVLEKFKNNNVWSSTASGAYSDKLNELIISLNKELDNIDKFEEALVLLDKIKQLEADIESLKNDLLSIPDDADEATKLSY